MRKNPYQNGYDELRSVRRKSRGLFWCTFIFSAFVNLLMLTGPMYMLQVYDRVLSSRSEATLVALSVLAIFLYGMMGILDYSRGRIFTRIAARFQTALDRRVFVAMIRRSSVSKDSVAQTGLTDLETIQRSISSPIPGAFFDLPWSPLFLAGIALFHPWLGWLALAGGGVLILLTFLNQLLTRNSSRKAALSGHSANVMSDEIRNEAEMIQSMGMRGASFDRWNVIRGEALTDSVATNDTNGGFTAITKMLRLMLQSAMLGLGAYLVLLGELSPGAMIAGSILMGRALAPIEQLLQQWSGVQAANKGWHNLAELLAKEPPETTRTELPKPKAHLRVEDLAVMPPGASAPTLRGLNFEIKPGLAIGVIGPSGCGKSTLARALTGVWPPAAGSVRLDRASLNNYDPDVLGQYIGYLPQRVQVFDGTIAQNIARLATEPKDADIVAAAKKADAHDMILNFPDGYDTHINNGGGVLSGGQMQRVGLARALYQDPAIVILDEPNSNLDAEGSMALNRAIKQIKEEGRAVMIMAHRPAAIQECDYLLVIENGMQAAFGPKDKVLEKMVANHKDIRSVPAAGEGQ